MAINWNLHALRAHLEAQTGRRVSLREISEGTGISQNTLSGMARNVPRRVDLDQLAVLLAFFRAQGLQVDLCDLLVEGEADQAAQGD